MPKVSIKLPTEKTSPHPLTVALVIWLGMMAFMVGLVFVMLNVAERHADEECTELCSALGHKKVKMTGLGCVCESPETQERTVHTGPAELIN